MKLLSISAIVWYVHGMIHDVARMAMRLVSAIIYNAIFKVKLLYILYIYI